MGTATGGAPGICRGTHRLWGFFDWDAGELVAPATRVFPVPRGGWGTGKPGRPESPVPFVGVVLVVLAEFDDENGAVDLQEQPLVVAAEEDLPDR